MINGEKDMNKDRKIAFDTHLIPISLLLVIFVAMAVFFLNDSEDGNIALAIACFALCAVPIFALLVSPFIYIFDRQGITVVYTLGFKERILWQEIRSVSKRGSWWHRGMGGGMPVFEMAYPRQKKYPFFVESSVARNRRTAALFKEYYKKDIAEY